MPSQRVLPRCVVLNYLSSSNKSQGELAAALTKMHNPVFSRKSSYSLLSLSWVQINGELYSMC